MFAVTHPRDECVGRSIAPITTNPARQTQRSGVCPVGAARITHNRESRLHGEQYGQYCKSGVILVNTGFSHQSGEHLKQVVKTITNKPVTHNWILVNGRN